MKPIIWLSLVMLVLSSPVRADDKRRPCDLRHRKPGTTGSSISDPYHKKSCWTFQTDRVYKYEIKDDNHKGSLREKSRGKRKE